MAEGKDRRKIAADRGARLEEQGEQLGLFGEEGAPIAPEARRGPGRPAGAPNKVRAKLREYLASQGYTDPAVQLARMAGLDRPDQHPLALAAAIAQQTGDDVLSVAREMRMAAAELLPYWHQKVSPDVTSNTVVNVAMMPAAPAQGAQNGPDRARDVTPQPRGIAPPPMPGQTVENQALSNAPREGSDE